MTFPSIDVTVEFPAEIARSRWPSAWVFSAQLFWGKHWPSIKNGFPALAIGGAVFFRPGGFCGRPPIVFKRLTGLNASLGSSAPRSRTGPEMIQGAAAAWTASVLARAART